MKNFYKNGKKLIETQQESKIMFLQQQRPFKPEEPFKPNPLKTPLIENQKNNNLIAQTHQKTILEKNNYRDDDHLKQTLKETLENRIIIPVKTIKTVSEETPNLAINVTSSEKLIPYLPIKTENITHLPTSLLKPELMSSKFFHHYHMLYSIRKAIDMGLPIKDVLIYATLNWGDPGDNIIIISHFFNKEVKKHLPNNLLDCLEHVDLTQIEPKILLALKKTNSVHGYMSAYEIMVVHRINQYFKEHKFIYAPTQKTPRNVTFYNNSPNNYPDNTLPLIKPIELKNRVVSEIGFDTKMGGTISHKNKDIVQTSSQDLGKSTENGHHHLLEQINNKLSANDISTEDLDRGFALQYALKENLQNYKEDGNEEIFVARYNEFHETYLEFLCRTRTGMNLQVLLTPEDFSINPEVSKKVSQIYEESCTSQASTANSYLTTMNYTEKSSITEQYHNLSGLFY